MAKKLVTPRAKPPKQRFFFREWRKHRGYNQEQLAEIVGVTPSTISQLETGKQGFTDTTLIALAEALSCSPGDLLMRNPLDTEAAALVLFAASKTVIHEVLAALIYLANVMLSSAAFVASRIRPV